MGQPAGLAAGSRLLGDMYNRCALNKAGLLLPGATLVQGQPILRATTHPTGVKSCHTLPTDRLHYPDPDYRHNILETARCGQNCNKDGAPACDGPIMNDWP